MTDMNFNVLGRIRCKALGVAIAVSFAMDQLARRQLGRVERAGQRLAGAILELELLVELLRGCALGCDASSWMRTGAARAAFRSCSSASSR